jgi:two-component system NtrC family sensor kinase
MLLAASLVVPALLLAAYAALTYQSAFDAARRDLQRTAEVAREHARKVLEAQDQVAERVNDLVRGMSDGEIRAAEQPLHATMARIIGQLPDVSSVMLIARDGRGLASSALLPVPSDLDFGDTDYIRGLAGPGATFIGRMRLGEVSHKPFLPMAHAATGAGGETNGAVVIGVQPRVFEEFYATMEGHAGAGQQDTVWLVRDDGSVVLRYPPRAATAPSANLAATLPAQIRQQPEHGVYAASVSIAPGSSRALFATNAFPTGPFTSSPAARWRPSSPTGRSPSPARSRPPSPPR